MITLLTTFAFAKEKLFHLSWIPLALGKVVFVKCTLFDSKVKMNGRWGPMSTRIHTFGSYK